jgi:hypothetical protein
LSEAAFEEVEWGQIAAIVPAGEETAAGFEEGNLEALLRENVSGDTAAGSAADDDGVVFHTA